MRILGLDIGSTSIKAVEVDTAFGRFEIHEYHEVPLSPGASAIDAAGGLVRSLPKSPDRVVVPLRANRVTLRNLKLPTRDKKAIQSSVGFELEDDLPFEADQAVSDFVILGNQGGESHVHVAATLRTTIEDYLGLAVPAGIDPDTLTTEASAYRALLHKIPVPETVLERPILIVNLGHERSTIYAQFNGIPLFCREIPWGGREVNVILSNRYALSVDASEKTKVDNGFVLPLSQLGTVSEQQRDFSETVYEALQGLVRDIRQADLSCKNLTGERAGMVYLAGGTSLLPGLPAVLSEETKIVCQPLRALSAIKSGVVYSEETDAKFALCAGAALSYVTSERPFLINFRKGTYAKSGRATELLDLSLFARPLKTLGVAAAILLVLLGVESTLYEQKLKETNVQLEKTVKSFFGNLTASTLRTYLANTSNLKRNIEAELNKERQLVQLLSPNPHSPFEFLRDLSAGIGKDIVTDLMRYQVGASAQDPYTSPSVMQPPVELEFWVANAAVAEKLTKNLEGKLRNFQKGPLEEVTVAKGPKRYKFKVTGSIGDPKAGK